MSGNPEFIQAVLLDDKPESVFRAVKSLAEKNYKVLSVDESTLMVEFSSSASFLSNSWGEVIKTQVKSSNSGSNLEIRVRAKVQIAGNFNAKNLVSKIVKELLSELKVPLTNERAKIVSENLFGQQKSALSGIEPMNPSKNSKSAASYFLIVLVFQLVFWTLYLNR